MLQGSDVTLGRAKALRRTMSLPEVLLWRALRDRPGAFKFRRQHPSGPYVADFYCHDARLVIEIDGTSHDVADRPMRDRARDAWFAVRRLDVMRVPARDVLADVDAVVRGIVARASDPLHRPAGGPPPHASHGEDFAGAR